MSTTWGNPWKVTAIGMALVMMTALVTGLVVANWTGPDTNGQQATSPKAEAPAKAAAPAKASAPVSASAPKPAPVRQATATRAPAMPAQAAVDACNQYASAQVQPRDKTFEVVKDAAVGAVLGAAVGAAGGAIADGGKGAGKGAAIGAVVGAGGGTLYGIHENRKQDEHYRAAYASCMRSRGYAS